MITKEMKHILRIEDRENRKIKDWKGLARYVRHCLRLQETLNADENRTDLNFCLQGNAADVKGTIEEYMQSKGLKLDGANSNNQSRLVTELMISASPEYFFECEKNADGSIKYEERINPYSKKIEPQAVYKLDSDGNRILKEKETMQWIMTTQQWLKAEYGDQYVFGMAHLDESTPHLSVLICGNSYHKKWKRYQLSHTANFGSDAKLRKMHTNHAEFMAAHGIKELHRGEESEYKRHHQAIKKGYNNANKLDKEVDAIKDKAINLLKEKDMEIEDIKKDLDTTKIKAIKEIKARDRVIKGLAQMTSISDNKINDALTRAKNDIEKELGNTNVTQDNTTGVSR